MILATVSTRNFDFQCLADTKENADRLLLAAWKVHLTEYRDADDDLMFHAVTDGEVNYVNIKVGTVLRDGEKLGVRLHEQPATRA